MGYLGRAPSTARSIGPLSLVFASVIIALTVSLWLSGASGEALRAAVVLAILLVLSLPVFALIAARDPEPALIFGVLIASFVFKLGAVAFRFQQRLLADAFAYDHFGLQIAEGLLQGIWPDLHQYWGTGFVRLVTGLTYFVLGPSIYGISIIFAWLGLLGMYFFYRAFSTAFPGGWRRLYMALVFFYPSLLLWTSSLGKDALILFLLGMATFGAAQVQRRVSGAGFLWLIIGLSGVLLIRPHVAAAFAAAFGAGALVWAARGRGPTPLVRVAGAAVFIALVAVIIGTSANFVNLESISPEGFSEVITTTQARTAQGGSAFRVSNPASLTGYLVALGTLLFRPFPWEVPGEYGLVAALESAFFLTLFVVRLRSVASALGGARRDSYLATIVIYILIVVFLFAAIANFGIIVRQRSSQLLPFLFMLLAYRGPSVMRR